MPLYEYLCANCETRFETLRPMSQADTPTPCPRCRKPVSQRAISVFAAISKDGGASRMVAGSGASSCATCSGGSCATCGH